MNENSIKSIDWAHKLPDHWAVIRIKYIADTALENSFADGDWIESPYITDAGIRYLTSGNIGDGIFKEQGCGYISEKTFAELNCKYAYPGDLVFSRLNAPFGRACILPDAQDKYVLAVDNVIVRTKQEVDKHFICYVAQCNEFHMKASELAKGTAMRRISRTQLGDMRIPFPPLHEQKDIVLFLNAKCAAIDEAIDRQKKIIEKLEGYRKAEISKTMMSLSEEIRAKYVFTIYAGATPKSDNLNYWDGDIVWVTPADFKTEDHYIEGSKRQLTTEGYASCNTTLVPVGSIIVSKRAPIGTVSINTVPLCTNQGCLACVVKDNADAEFFYYALIFKNEHMQVLGAGTTFQEISATAFANMKIPYADMGTQKKIAARLNNIDESIRAYKSTHESIIKKLEEYRKSIIYNAVTGKIDCRKEGVMT